MKRKSITLAVAAFSALGAISSQAAVLITQYYEGPATNKWIEITNIGSTTIDLAAGNYNLSLFTNATTENYKTSGAAFSTLNLTGILAAGASSLYGNANNTTPSYATATATSSTVINFNGDDSIALWTGTTFATSSIVDAIGFTDVGNEGADKSFVRASASAGWNTTAGSDVLDFSSIWTSVTNATVDGATAGTNNRLGFSSVAVPEPSSALLGGLGLLALLRRRR
jgi:predicted extracellular nuclease